MVPPSTYKPSPPTSSRKRKQVLWTEHHPCHSSLPVPSSPSSSPSFSSPSSLRSLRPSLFGQCGCGRAGVRGRVGTDSATEKVAWHLRFRGDVQGIEGGNHHIRQYQWVSGLWWVACCQDNQVSIRWRECNCFLTNRCRMVICWIYDLIYTSMVFMICPILLLDNIAWGLDNNIHSLNWYISHA